MKLFKWLLLLGGLSLISAFVVFNVISYRVLWQIKHKPLPLLERGEVRYKVRDLGAEPEAMRAFYEWNDGRFTWQFTDDERVIFDAPAGAARAQSWKRKRIERAARLKRDHRYIEAIDGDRTLMRYHELKPLEPTDPKYDSWGNDLELWNDKTLAASCPPRVRAYKSWPVRGERLFFFGADGSVIGTGQIATAFATAGGRSEPHGRYFPFVWDGKTPYLSDINSHIDATSGWYLYRALAVNKRGQILCLGAKTDALGAEKSDIEKMRRLLLTPIKAPSN